MVADQWSSPGLTRVIGRCRSPPSGSVRTTVALAASCPSRKTVAVTSKGSPTTDLAGNAPCSIQGATWKTGMRPRVRGASRFGAADGGVAGGRGLAVTHLTLLVPCHRAPPASWVLLIASVGCPSLQDVARSCKKLQGIVETSPMILDREGYPSLQRPHRPARVDQRAGRARQQLALVLALPHAGPVLRDRPEALGHGRQGPHRHAFRAVGRRAPGPCLQ